MPLACASTSKVIGEAADGAEALSLARELKPDVVLMDLLMPVMDGIAATAAIRRELPDTEVLALTSVLEDASVVGAVRAGAIGYLLKDTQAEALCQAIKAAAAGQVQLTPKAAARLMQAVSAPESPEALTERETEVLRLLAQGQSNMNATIQDTLLDLFHQVIDDPDRIPAVPIDSWQEGSEQRHLLTGFRDMLERMRQNKLQAEEQLLEREEQYRSIFEARTDGILIADLEDSRLVEVNPAACRMFGYAREEFLGRTVGLSDDTQQPPVHARDVVRAGSLFQLREN